MVIFDCSLSEFIPLKLPPIKVTVHRKGYGFTTANLCTTILDFRGLDSSTILTLRGRIPRPIRGLPGKFESTNLSRDNLSMEIGRAEFCETLVVVLGITVAGYYEVQPLPLQTLPFAQPDI